MIYTLAFNGLDYAVVDKNTDAAPNTVACTVTKILDNRLLHVGVGNQFSSLEIRRYDNVGTLLQAIQYVGATIEKHEDNGTHLLVFRFKEKK